MGDKRIEVVKNWPEPKSSRNIIIFISFVYFYWKFIQNFSIIAAPVTSILRTIESSNMVLRELGANDNEAVRGGGKADNRNLSQYKKLKNAKSGIQTYIRATQKPTFLIRNAKEGH